MFLRQPIQLIQLFTTLVTPQRGDNGYNFLLGRRPNGRWKEFGVETVKVVKVVEVVWVVLKKKHNGLS
jgi:hypothetical protein